MKGERERQREREREREREKTDRQRQRQRELGLLMKLYQESIDLHPSVLIVTPNVSGISLLCR